MGQGVSIGSALSLSTAGTLNLATLGAGLLFGNYGTASAVGQGVSIGSALSLSTAGTINLATIATQTILGNAGTATAVPGALSLGSNLTITSGGTLLTDNQGTITLVGSTTGTVSPAGVSSVLVNVGTANGTIAVSSGSFNGQHLRLEVKQGATPHTVSFDTTVEFGTDVTSYTATNTANLRDLIQLIWQGSYWMFAAVNHGFA